MLCLLAVLTWGSLLLPAEPAAAAERNHWFAFHENGVRHGGELLTGDIRGVLASRSCSRTVQGSGTVSYGDSETAEVALNVSSFLVFAFGRIDVKTPTRTYAQSVVLAFDGYAGDLCYIFLPQDLFHGNRAPDWLNSRALGAWCRTCHFRLRTA
ncbi:MAG: hypothetical protein DYH08_17860, partial [Actinobacteria bacterium ATB1]|nr:hypothetical protein [Actinobacteria bacterium ATB1]